MSNAGQEVERGEVLSRCDSFFDAVMLGDTGAAWQMRDYLAGYHDAQRELMNEIIRQATVGVFAASNIRIVASGPHVADVIATVTMGYPRSKRTICLGMQWVMAGNDWYWADIGKVADGPCR
jgi:hypothetical protein